MDKGIKERERERERERDTERVRRGRGRWRSGDWSRSSRGWGERRRIGKAIRSCLGLIPLLLRTPIPLAKSTLDLRSFSLSLSLSLFRSYYYSFLLRHQINWIVFWRRPSCCYCFDTLTLTVVVLVGAICKTKWGKYTMSVKQLKCKSPIAEMDNTHLQASPSVINFCYSLCRFMVY